MNENDKDEKMRFSEIMYGLAENYPGSQLTKAGLKLRFEALKDFDIDQISQAATQLIRNRKYSTMPTVAEIIEVIPGNNQLELKPTHKAEVEADKVLTHLRRLGRTVTPMFDDSITRFLMSNRWRYPSWAATVSESELKWWRKEFIEAYQAHHESGQVLQIEAPMKIKQLAAGIGKGL